MPTSASDPEPGTAERVDSQTLSVAVTTLYTVLHPISSQPSSQGNERKTVGGVSAQPPQPAVMVAGTTHAAVTQVLHTSVVETTAAQPETETIETDPPSWPRAGPALEDVSLGNLSTFRESQCRCSQLFLVTTYTAIQVARALKA